MNLNFINISIFWMEDDITEDNNFAVQINYNGNDNNDQLLVLNQNNNINENDLINQEKIRKIKDLYNSLRVSDIYQDYDKLKDAKIGSLNPFKYYIQLDLCTEKNYEEILQLDISNLDIYKYRRVKGDGNCFYRSFIFSFIENIILKNNIILMNDIYTKFNQFFSYRNDLPNQYNINFEEIIVILYIIIDYMQTDNNNLAAFQFFQKAYLFSKSLDDGIVLFMRYLIKEYLFSNQNSYYENNINLPIGTLLPDEYKRGDTYLFEEYYNNDLMKMYEDAKDIAVYTAPYALNCEFNIFELKYEDNNINKSIFCTKERINPNEDDPNFIRINLIYNSEIMHYELVYTKTFFEENYNYLLDLTKNINSKTVSKEDREHLISKLYIKYLKEKSSSNLKDDFLKYINYYPFFSENKLIGKENVENIIKKEEKKICIKCFRKDFKEAYFEFYCGCKICKEECFKKYIEPDEDDENKIYYDYFTKCLCGEQFSKKKVEDYLEKHENKDKDKYDLLIQAHWKWRCMVCNDTFNRRFRYYRLIFKEKCEFTKKNLEHLICFECKNNIKNEKTINCKFCDISHEIKSISYVDEDNKNESICIII